MKKNSLFKTRVALVFEDVGGAYLTDAFEKMRSKMIPLAANREEALAYLSSRLKNASGYAHAHTHYLDGKTIRPL